MKDRTLEACSIEIYGELGGLILLWVHKSTDIFCSWSRDKKYRGMCEWLLHRYREIMDKDTIAHYALTLLLDKRGSKTCIAVEVVRNS